MAIDVSLSEMDIVAFKNPPGEGGVVVSEQEQKTSSHSFYAQLVKKPEVGFERWLAVGRSRQPGCDHKPIPQMGPHEKILLH